MQCVDNIIYSFENTTVYSQVCHSRPVIRFSTIIPYGNRPRPGRFGKVIFFLIRISIILRLIHIHFRCSKTDISIFQQGCNRILMTSVLNIETRLVGLAGSQQQRTVADSDFLTGSYYLHQ